MGLEVQLLTGDRVESAQAVSQKLGISQFHAQVLPADKARVVRQLQQAGRVVVMVGDGVNDAPVLATADVGMAMGAGTDVAQAAAPVTIASRQLTSISAGLGLARQTLRIVKQNLGLAFVYNLIGIPLAAGLFYPLTGWLLPPLFAAAAMSLSSVSVVMNSLRLRSYSAPD
jgi:Cu+-exporting ATPase